MWLTRGLAHLTVSILAYCFIAALNARSTFIPAESSFVHHDSLPWLPHSYDSTLSWQTFWNLLAIACTFWAVRDWLLSEPRTKNAAHEPSTNSPPAFPKRLQLLLWVLSINGALLALQGLIQHTAGDGRLLWILEPSINKSPDAQFGPYAYRSNAAQYFLLVWPVALGFWWSLRKQAQMSRRRRQTHNYLLPCIFLMGLVPLISLSRAGAIIGAATLIAALFLLLGAQWRSSGWSRGVLLLLVGALAIAGLMEWQNLSRRFTEGLFDSGRHEIWLHSVEILKEHPLFGTGPGTFESVYHMYRPHASDPWHATVHNDWLETLVTFGILGSLLVFSPLILVLLRCFVPGQIPAPRFFIQMLYLALASCLVYALVDLPMQVYSVLFLFVINCCVLMCLRIDSDARTSLRQ